MDSRQISKLVPAIEECLPRNGLQHGSYAVDHVEALRCLMRRALLPAGAAVLLILAGKSCMALYLRCKEM